MIEIDGVTYIPCPYCHLRPQEISGKLYVAAHPNWCPLGEKVTGKALAPMVREIAVKR